MALSYEFSIGSVRARERYLLRQSDIEQMLTLGSENDLVRFLRDKGFGKGNTLDELIESNKSLMWKYLKGIAPDFGIFEPFFCKNDIHNLKTILKGVMSERKFTDLLVEPSTVSPEDMIKAVENRRFDRLPEWLEKPADKAYGLLAETKDARMSDAVIDRAVLEKFLKEAKKSKSEFLQKYFAQTVYYADIKVALRASRTGTRDYYLEEALCEVEGFDKKAVSAAALKGHEALVKYLEKQTVYDCPGALDEYKKSPSLFEKYIDNSLMKLTKKYCRYSSEGLEPMMGYYLACEQQSRQIYIIASGLKTNTPAQVIRERLRENYG